MAVAAEAVESLFPAKRAGETFLTRKRRKIAAMESPILARQSVLAEVSEFFRAELDAFVRESRNSRPRAWALVERLQSVCLESSPATPSGLGRSIEVLRETAIA